MAGFLDSVLLAFHPSRRESGAATPTEQTDNRSNRDASKSAGLAGSYGDASTLEQKQVPPVPKRKPLHFLSSTGAAKRRRRGRASTRIVGVLPTIKNL